MKKINRTILSFFGIGFLPLGQGTIASMAGAAFFIGFGNLSVYPALVLIPLVLGFFLIKDSLLDVSLDPPWIVMDEVCGMMITYLFLPKTFKIIIAGFLLFRFFDILKVYPINKAENLKGRWGIMLDDILAGIFSNLILQVVLKFASNILV